MKSARTRLLFVAVFAVLVMCGAALADTPYFQNMASSAGLANTGSGNGAAWIDYDNDGDLDLYLINDPGSGGFYHNNLIETGSATFTNVSVGVTGNGGFVPTADYNADGYVDVLVGSNASAILYRNKADATFENVTASSGISVGNSSCPVWGDYYDKDGKPDLYFGEAGKLYRNNGDGTFTDTTSAAFPSAPPAAVPAWIDYDNDGYDDLFLAPPAGSLILYRNNGDGTFEDVSASAGINLPGQSGGRIATGDYNTDTYEDIYLFAGGSDNCLFRNNGNGTFTEVALTAGVKTTAGNGTNGGAVLFDFDRDGDLDLFANGGRYGSNNFFRNNGDRTFTDITPLTGLSNTDDTHRIAIGDFNADGFPDIYEINFTGYGSSANKLFKNLATAPGSPPPAIQWTRIADLPGDQHAACAAVVDGRVYMVGGQNPSGPPNYNKMRIYNPETNSWSDGPSMSTRRYWPASGVIEGPNGLKQLYVVGGYSGYAGLATVERYTPSMGTWETVASLSEPRGHCIMTAVVNNNLYAIGGFYNGSSFYATNEMYDTDNNVWVTKTALPFPLQTGLETVWADKIYIFGGNNASGSKNTTMIYDTFTDTWSEGAEIPRSRYYTKAATLGSYIYLIGGAGSGDPTIDVYHPLSDSWSTTDDYPGSNADSPIITQTSSLVYVLGDPYSLPGALECWVGQLATLPAHDQCSGAIAVEVNEPYNGSTEYATGTDVSSCTSNDINDVWHSFTAQYTTDYTISLCGSTFDTTLAVFDECDGAELACNDDTEPDVCPHKWQSQLTIALEKGSTYLIRIAGWNGETGDYMLTVIGPECAERPAMDFNDDCRVNFVDLGIFLQSWLECNLEPNDLCWQ